MGRDFPQCDGDSLTLPAGWWLPHAGACCSSLTLLARCPPRASLQWFHFVLHFLISANVVFMGRLLRSTRCSFQNRNC